MTGVRMRVVEDPHAPDERRYRAIVSDPELGGLDAAGPDKESAQWRAYHRWRLYWLGIDCPGLVRLPGTESSRSGQVALNGHRFALWRQLDDPKLGRICWIMLNPSTADHEQDDTTLRRIRRYSIAWGYGWLTVGNLWSYRATSPKQLKQWIATNAASERRRGPMGIIAENDRYVLSMAERAELVVCAWGSDGRLEGRADEMLRLLKPYNVHALAVTRAGEPSAWLRI